MKLKQFYYLLVKQILFWYFFNLKLLECNRKRSISQEIVDKANANIMNSSLTGYNSQAAKLIDLLNKLTKMKTFPFVTARDSSSNLLSTSTHRNFITSTNLIKSFINSINSSVVTTSKPSRSQLSEFNGSQKGSALDTDRKESVLDKINITKIIQNKKLVECLNCSELKDKTECNQLEDYDMNQIVNIFCCECNPFKKNKQHVEKSVQEMIKKSKEDTKHSWFVNIIILSLIGVVICVILILLIIFACRLKKNKQLKIRYNPDEFIKPKSYEKSEHKSESINDSNDNSNDKNAENIDNSNNNSSSSNNNIDNIDDNNMDNKNAKNDPSIDSKCNIQMDKKLNLDEIESENPLQNRPDPNFSAVLQSYEKISANSKNKISAGNESRLSASKEKYTRADCTKSKSNKFNL